MHTMFKIRPIAKAIWSIFGVPPMVRQATQQALIEELRKKEALAKKAKEK